MLEPPRILNINVDLGQEAVRTIKAADTFEDTSVTWPLESIKIRVSISLDDTQDPSSYLSPFLSQIRARLHEPMARLSIDIIVPVDTRRNIFRASLSLSLSLFHGERCNRVFPHHDTLKRCQVLDDGHSLPWPGHTGRQDIVHYHRRALVCFSLLPPASSLSLRLPLLFSISLPPPTFLFRFSRLVNPGRELTF